MTAGSVSTLRAAAVGARDERAQAFVILVAGGATLEGGRARPGRRASASSPASSSSTYWSRSSKHSSQLTSGSAGPSTRAIRSRCRVVCAHAPPPVVVVEVVAGVGERRAELAPGVVEGLIERAAGARQALGEHVDRYAVERKRREHLALVRGERGLLRRARSRAADRLLRSVCGPRARRRRAAPRVVLERDLAALPGTAASLHSGFEQDELVRPGREPAGAAERVELGEDRGQGVVGRLVARSSTSSRDRRASSSGRRRARDGHRGPAARAVRRAPRLGPVRVGAARRPWARWR